MCCDVGAIWLRRHCMRHVNSTEHIYRLLCGRPVEKGSTFSGESGETVLVIVICTSNVHHAEEKRNLLSGIFEITTRLNLTLCYSCSTMFPI